MSWIEPFENGVTVNIRALPNADRNEISGIHGNALKVRVQSPPVDGKANKALIKFISKKTRISKSKITILRGLKGRDKTIAITTESPEAVKHALIG
jgi:uncharacterized protein (TIGR00251 family)